MATFICKPTCAPGLPNFGIVDDCDVVDSFASGEIAKVIPMNCGLNFTDVDSATEWTSAIQLSKISVLPDGNGKIDAAARSGDVRVKCITIQPICKKPFDFTTRLVDNTSQTDVAKYNSLTKQVLGLGVTFLTCDGYLLIDPDWAAGKSPSIKLASFYIDQVFDGVADGQMYYQIKGELSTCKALKRVKLSAATALIFSTAIATSGGTGI